MANFKLSKSLQDDIQKKSINYIQNKSPRLLTSQFEKIKSNLISEFLLHPVTKEIRAGAYSDNISGTLSNIDFGNLFSFIGFELGTDPISEIESELNKIEINLIKSISSTSISIKFPTPDDIWAVTPMPWQEGRSWAKGIESGISGLNYYFFSKKVNDISRSSTAVQSKKQIRSYARYTPTQYISTLLKKYKTIFSSKYSKNQNIFVNIEK